MSLKLLYTPTAKEINIVSSQLIAATNEVVTSNYSALFTVTKLSRFYKPESNRIRKVHVLLGIIEHGTLEVELAVAYKNYGDNPASPYDILIEPSLLSQFHKSLQVQFQNDLIDFLIRSEGA